MATRPVTQLNARSKNLLPSRFTVGCVTLLGYCAAMPAVLHAEDYKIALAWNVIENGSQEPPAYESELVLTNNGDLTLGSGDWQLYFNFCRKILPASVTESVRIIHVNGDLFRMEPASSFAPLNSGKSRKIRFRTNAWVIKESDAPSGCYLVVEDESGQSKIVETIGDVSVGPIVSERQTARTPEDIVPAPTPLLRYRENSTLGEYAGQLSDRIVPTPRVFKAGSGEFVLDTETTIYAREGLTNEAEYLADALYALLGMKPRASTQNPHSSKIIELSISDLLIDGAQKTAGDHSYRLSVQGDAGITIVGTDPTGVFYGIQSLRALLPVNAYRQVNDRIPIAAVQIEDAPRFRYRGVHLDVARNFQKPTSVKKLLELMAFYKLNKFHFHLTDDEGWRLEIAGLPELSEVGGRRSHALGDEQSLPPSFGSGPHANAVGSYGSGYYSRQEFIDILRFAAERHIEVIPEIDLPGHARAAIKAMEARHDNLHSNGRDEEARQFLLHDPGDDSQYESVQMWNDNVINVFQDSTYAFIRHVITDIRSMYAEAGIVLTTMHLGGDEVPQGVWQKSSAFQQLLSAAGGSQAAAQDEAMGQFFGKVSDQLASEKVVTAAWEEVFLSEDKKAPTSRDSSRNRFSGPNYLCFVWNNVWGWGQEDAAYRLANAGTNVVLCNATHLYFDLAYDKDPREPGYYWAGFVDTKAPYSFEPGNYLAKSRKDLLGREISQDGIAQRVQLTETGERHVLGIQGLLWGENLKGEKSLEYMALPKLIALAERAWAKQPEWARDRDLQSWPTKLEQDWSEFANRLGTRELPRLDYLEGGFHYRIPDVGAVIEDGVLKANVAFPGLAIRFTTDGSEPDENSLLFTEPVSVGDSARVRAFNLVGRGGRSSIIQERDLRLAN